MVLIKLEDWEYEVVLKWLRIMENFYRIKFDKAPEKYANQLLDLIDIINKLSEFEPNKYQKLLETGGD